ncbi:MAG TPA: YaiI/YqxD family protein [Alphaproteobacteria bacterium]|nr:YaiI/YqxD family protein [Alphaproteobacteria bacterium]
MTKLYVDADACPVKDEAIRVAERHRVPVSMVSNGGIRPNPHPLVSTVIVPEGPDAADKWIADRIGPGDICITGDVPLAARCIEAGAKAIQPNGELFTATNMGQRLAMRDLMADIRAANPLAAGGKGRTFSKADRSRFLDKLETLVREAKRTSGGSAA